MIKLCGAANRNPQSDKKTHPMLRHRLLTKADKQTSQTIDSKVIQISVKISRSIYCIQCTVHILRIEVIIRQLKVVVITKLPEDSPRGFMPAPLDK